MGLLAFSAFIIVLTGYQASVETVPDSELFKAPVYVRSRKYKLSQAAVEEVEGYIKGPWRYLLVFQLRHAKEYLRYEADAAAVYEASRALRFLTWLRRTTSR